MKTKYTEDMLPQGHRVRVKHFHNGNSSEEFRDHKPYVTLASVLDTNQVPVGFGVSACSKRDTPNRKLGRQIAIGRAVKDFMKSYQNLVIENA